MQKTPFQAHYLMRNSMPWRGLLALCLAVSFHASAFSAAENKEEMALRAVITLNSEGALGFKAPDGWTFVYHSQFGACAKMLGSSCIPVVGDNRFKEEGNLTPVRAITTRSENHTMFFRDSASADSAITIAYADPSSDDFAVMIIAPQPFTDMEMAAYVIGHEVHGHLLNDHGGDSISEMKCNYYGLQAVMGLRKILSP